MMSLLSRTVHASTIMTRFASTSAYRQTNPINKGASSLHLKDLHVKEKLITVEKSLGVLAICAVAMMLPAPYSKDSGLEPGLTEIDCMNCFEEPFDSH